MIVLIGALGIGALVATLAATSARRALDAVPFVRPTAGAVREVITGKGTVNYQHQAIMRALRQGRVARVLVQEGQQVRAGQPLVQIVDPDAAMETETRGKDQAKLVAKIDALNRNVADLERLVAAGASPRSELEQKRLELDLATTDLDLARLEQAKLHQVQARAQVSSPFNGVVVSTAVALGQWVNVGEDIATLAGASNRQIVAYVDATDLPRLTVGQPVDFSNQPDGGPLRRGHIASIGDVVDAAQRQNAVRVTIHPDQPIADLRISQQLYLEFVVHEVDHALRIPRGYVQQARGHSVVQVLGDHGIEFRAVVLGAGDRHFDQVLSGLTVRDRLVRPDAREAARQ